MLTHSAFGKVVELVDDLTHNFRQVFLILKKK